MILAFLQFELHATGHNRYGKLGLGLDPKENTTVNSFLQMKTDLGFVRLNIGTNHLVAITNESKLYMWGLAIENSFLSVEDGSHTSPKEITYFTKNKIAVKDGDAGAFHTGVLGTNKKVYLFGQNSFGQLGRPKSVLDNTNGTPVIITAADLDGSDPVQVAIEFETTFIVTAKGAVYVSGACRNHICGPNIEAVEKFTPLEIDFSAVRAFIGNQSIFIESNKGEMYGIGENEWYQLCLPEKKNYTEFTKIEGLSAIRDVSVGTKHTIFVTRDHVVLGCGYGTTSPFNNTDPNLELKTPTQFIEGTVDSAACTAGGTLYTKEGKMYAVGEEYKYELGYQHGKDLSREFLSIYFDEDIESIIAFGDYSFAFCLAPLPEPVDPMKSTLEWWAILLIAVGALAVLGVIGFAVFYFMRRKGSNRQSKAVKDDANLNTEVMI